MITIADGCRGFKAARLDPSTSAALRETARKARGDILKMTTLAGSGHPGGSMSSIDLYLTLHALARIDPRAPDNPARDRIVISHGHTSPGVYAALGNLGFFPVDEAIAHFRQAGGPFEGHVERNLPGVDWSSGNLGQGLSAGCGMALASNIRGLDNQVVVFMGDGEQQKGQIAEARRFAIKYSLTRLTVVVDWNGLQISGRTGTVMPQNLQQNFVSDGWRVLEIDGHDVDEIYGAFREAAADRECCVAILARTVMGKGVSFMENDEKWHGQALDEALLDKALAELGLENDLPRYKELRRKGATHLAGFEIRPPAIRLAPGTPRLYPPDKLTDNRSAWGKALEEVAAANAADPQATPIAVLDCDLAGSVKTSGFAAAHPERFFQSGIMEHHTAVAAGALSTQDVQVFWADFGVFGIDEVYNQQRINDINETNLKVVCTHLGLDVGEDGKTHQCIDYLGLLQNLYRFRPILPADPNQTDRVVRWAAGQPGNYFIGLGRSKVPVIRRPDGTPFFDDRYEFIYGRADQLRGGQDAVIATMGTLAARAVQAADELAAEGLSVAVIHFSCPKEADPAALAAIRAAGVLISYEDHNRDTGLGSILARRLATGDLSVRFLRLGAHGYATSGATEDVLRSQGLDVEGLKTAVRRLVEVTRPLEPVPMADSAQDAHSGRELS
jgi:transketolase